MLLGDDVDRDESNLDEHLVCQVIGAPELLDGFSERYRRLRASLAELAPADSPLDPQRWALVTLALSNGFALERLIDPDGVPGDLMADMQRRLLQPPAG